MFLQGLDRLLNTADIPEPDLTVISAAGKIVLAVGVEIEVAHQLAMGILYTVNLTAQDRERIRKEEDKNLPGTTTMSIVLYVSLVYQQPFYL